MELFDVMNHCNRCSVEDVKAVANLIETARAAKIPRRGPIRIKVSARRAWSAERHMRSKLHRRKTKR